MEIGWLPNPLSDHIMAREVGQRHIMPTSKRFIFSTPAFYMSKVNGAWHTLGTGMRLVSHQPIYPDLPGNEGNLRVLRVIQHVQGLPSQEPLDTIAFCYACHVSSSKPANHDIFRCHPSYHSYPWSRRPWNDWAMISWTRSVGREERKYSCAAKILLWAYALPSTSSPFDREQTSVDRMFGVVQSLSSWTPRQDRTCGFFQFDTLEEDLRVVQVDTIESVAYVLPTVNDGADQMEEALDGGKAFYVIPPRASWSDIGWDSPLLSRVKKFLDLDLQEEKAV